MRVYRYKCWVYNSVVLFSVTNQKKTISNRCAKSSLGIDNGNFTGMEFGNVL